MLSTSPFRVAPRRTPGLKAVREMSLATACRLDNYLVLPDVSMDDRITAAKKALGRECVILGHHYQRDEVIKFADFRGDSYKLSQQAAQAAGRYIVFCGVHFMQRVPTFWGVPRNKSSCLT